MSSQSSEMNTDKQAAISYHVQALSKLLFEEVDSQQLTNLAEIEVAVREQVQTHVTPEMGFFLSNR